MNTHCANSVSSGTLFTISQSWHKDVAIYEQLAFASTGDTILLVQDAVLALHSSITLPSFVAKCESTGINIVALKEDCKLRGIESKIPSIAMVDYAGYVELVCKHNKQVSW